LLNLDGQIRAALRMDGREPSFDLYDAAGKPRLSMTTQGATTIIAIGSNLKEALTISVDDGEPHVTMRDKAGAKRLSFWVHDVEPQIRFYGKDAKPGLAMYMADQSPVLMLCNDKGPQMMMAVSEDSSRLSLGNPLANDNKPERILMTVSNDEPVLQFSDSQGHHRLGLKATKGETVLGINDADGKYRFSLNAAANDIRLSMLDEAGKTRLAMRQDANEDATLAFVNDTGKVIWTAP
jgi:uncharacterized protein YegP (UPF0339 family)